MRTPSTANSASSLSSARPLGLADLPRRIVDTLLLWQRRASERRHLLSMDDRLLQDLGVSRLDVEFEASKPFWRA
ncbi:MAG: DUF1127 domain-containing protein [Proteobacteria bacterium]|nr:DUF1127 domain-containing protein [Pseudomonadota bacterium]MBI3499539.1 DUF1127 domain-containing protein [Pseudomonadota bacterium]